MRAKGNTMRCIYGILATISVYCVCFDASSDLIQAVKQRDHRQVRKALQNSPDASVCENALVLASYQGYSKITGILLQNSVSPEARDTRGQTPLYAGALAGNYKVVRMLLAYGANPNSKNHGMTPVFAAARSGSVKVIQALIDAGACLNVYNEYNETPLHVAVGKGRVKAVKCFMDYRVNVAARDNHGMTPLHTLAVIPNITSNDRNAIASILLKGGAALNARNNSGRTVRELAQVRGYTRLKRLLQKYAQ